jgi:integrase/recombinase XerD
MKLDHHGQAEPIFLDEYRKIREHFRTPRERLLWDIAYYTGERWGAIVQLAVSDVYDNRGKPRPSITFKKNTRKDKSTRQVPISSRLALRLKAYAIPHSHWLFPSPRFADRHISIRAADTSFRVAIDRAGFAGLGYSTHSTRRGFITSLHRNGFDIRVIQEITGHKNLAVLSRYIEVTDEQKKSALATL